jgi:outer membrane protein OmpA-like peptidoglycan-associated protein
MYLRSEGAACQDGNKHPESVDFHSGTRDMTITASAGVTQWSYCLQITKKGSQVSMDDLWPVQGQLDLDLIDPDRGHWLPQAASMISLPFPNNVSILSSDMKQLMDAVLTNIGGPNNVQIQIHAHASEIGDPEYNHDLSIMRLKHVREWLQEEGAVPRSAIWGQAWGESRPFAIKTIEDEESQNRRVDVVFFPIDDSDVKKDSKTPVSTPVFPKKDSSAPASKSESGVEVIPHEPPAVFDEQVVDPDEAEGVVEG